MWKCRHDGRQSNSNHVNVNFQEQINEIQGTKKNLREADQQINKHEDRLKTLSVNWTFDIIFDILLVYLCM